MKAFIASLSIILVIIAFTVISGLYVKAVTDRLLDLEAQFPEKEDGESSPSSVITESEELLNFEASQQEAADYQVGYVIIGIVVVLMGAFLIVYAVLSVQNKKTATNRKKRSFSKSPLREAKKVCARILLKAQKGNYTICYRRVGFTNELVINGEVWDELKAIMEEKHNLSAIVDGNKIEAGYTEKPSASYIKFNGVRIAHKKRWI